MAPKEVERIYIKVRGKERGNTEIIEAEDYNTKKTYGVGTKYKGDRERTT